LIRQVLAVCLALVTLPALAGNWPELKLSAEHPIDGMRGGNLSGLAHHGRVDLQPVRLAFQR